MAWEPITDLTGPPGEDGEDADASALVPRETVRAHEDTDPVWRTDITDPNFDSDLADLVQHYVNGVLVSWFNEWGALRGRNPYAHWADSLIRAVVQDGDNTNGNYIELNDRRTGAPYPVLHGRRWSDGRLVRNGVLMADVYVTSNADTDPNIANLPDGTVVVETS